MRYVTLLAALLVGTSPVLAQDDFALAFDHTTVLVADLERSEAFYGDILRLAPLETPWGPAAPIRFFSLGSARQLHIGESDERPESNRGVHLAFAVANFDKYLRFLRARGVEYSNFEGSSASPQLRPDGVRQVYLQDPDGNWIEINDAAHPPV
jgi:lactoylglutathione lyase